MKEMEKDVMCVLLQRLLDENMITPNQENNMINVFEQLNGFKGTFDGNNHTIYGLYIDDAIDEQIELGTIQYDRMVYFEKDLDGKITALKTNMSEVNRLKTNILDLINDEILAADSSRLGIPIGSLIFPEFFSGKGIQIPVTIHSVSNSDASFTSNFSEAGINQTLQQIIMDIQIDVTVLVLGKTNSFTISSHIVVAETVIVGQVPNTYFQAGGALNGS